MKTTYQARLTLAVALAALLAPASSAEAYIGPGAGFAVGTTLFAFFMAVFSGMAAIVLWPLRYTVRAVRGRKAMKKARVRRVVVLGLDGLEPSLVERYMADGKLANLSKLKERGCFRRLATTAPPLSPVAWSTFLTGCNPGKHNIYDFLTRDRHNYRPQMSSVRIRAPQKTTKIGKYRLPLERPEVRLLRKGKPFWNVLGEHGVFSNIIRVPITFPPEGFHGVLLSAMCVPDLRGTQGTFSFYTTQADDGAQHTGGEQIRVTRCGDTIRGHLIGPTDGLVDSPAPLTCPFVVKVTGAGRATVSVAGKTRELVAGEYTPWVTVEFKGALGAKVRGICEFHLIRTEPHFELYVTPIQIDPSKPAMPISHPSVFSTYLAKRQGPYATLGLAEDTWGLNSRILDDEGFLHQCIEADSEREAMFFDALEKVHRGLCVCVFDGTDRIQHMFWRYIDQGHPADNGQGGRQRRQAIGELYARMDALVGRTMSECRGEGNVLFVISDHGFNSFRRGIDLNVWLEQNGYLARQSGEPGGKYLAGVDWSKTKAFCLGLAGIWLNVRGREVQGIVDPKEADALRDQIAAKLTGLRDEERGAVAVKRAFNSRKIYHGPYVEESPDLILGYNAGYRVSWEAAIGEITDSVFHDNTKAWSGDHCVDPSLVPGVLFCSEPIEAENPRLMDVGPTVLDLFGVDVPRYMDGKAFGVAVGKGRSNGHGASSPDRAAP